VCASGKQNEAKPPIEIGVFHLLGSLSVVVLVKDPSLPCVVYSLFQAFRQWSGSENNSERVRRLKLRTRSSMTSMTGERLSGLAMMLIPRGINYMTTPKDIYERKSNWRHLL